MLCHNISPPATQSIPQKKMKDYENTDSFYRAPDSSVGKPRFILADMNMDGLVKALQKMFFKIEQKAKENQVKTMERKIKHTDRVYLSALEYRLLLVFINNRGAVLSRTQLLESIWDIAGEFVNDNTLTVYIKRLREKIEYDAQNPVIIKTVRGLGYKVDV